MCDKIDLIINTSNCSIRIVILSKRKKNFHQNCNIVLWFLFDFNGCCISILLIIRSSLLFSSVLNIVIIAFAKGSYFVHASMYPKISTRFNAKNRTINITVAFYFFSGPLFDVLIKFM